MKTIFSEEELSVMDALEVKGGRAGTVIQNCIQNGCTYSQR